MSDLVTNVIALPATTRSIEWHHYEASYPQTSSEYGSDVLSVCRELLDARIPCVWGPKSSLDSEISNIRSFIGKAQLDQAKNSGVPKLTAVASWSIWVFHAFAPEQKALRAPSIPPEFKVVGSGQISWKAPESEPSFQSPDATGFQQEPGLEATSPDTQTVHALFHRALDNLVDRALLPLSIVRFGFRQWITLSSLPPTTAKGRSSEQQIGTAHPAELSQPPLTPTSPVLDLPPDAEDFLAASTKLEADLSVGADRSAKPPGPSPPFTTHILRFNTAISNCAVLLQPNAQPAPSLCPVADSIGQLKRTNPSQQPAAEKDQQWPAVAAARVAPYGIPADIVSVPETHMGESEDRTLDAWSRAFGYPREFLTVSGAIGEPAGRSNLLWIRLRSAEEPLLYPRKLVLVDKNALRKADSATNPLEPTETASADTDVSSDPAAASLQAGAEAQQDLGRDDGDKSDGSAAKTERELFGKEEGEEAEEGEELSEEEGEYDEEGEIASDPAPAHPATNTTTTTTTTAVEPAPVASAELDAIVAELRTATSRSMEKSLAAIQESMAAFQAELRVEQEQEETRKREKLEKERAAAAAAAAAQGALTEVSRVSNARSAGGSSSRKRPRSNTRDEPSGSNKSRRKSVSSAAASNGKQTTTAQAAPTTVDTPSQVATPDDSIPLAQSLLNGAADSVLAADPATAAVSAGAPADIDSLFGGATMGVGSAPALDGENSGPPDGDMGLGFGQLGDDMALGMGMGMGMGMGGLGDNLDVGMSDFSTSMFGVTDDDFNFFDSVPAAPHQPKVEAAPAVVAQSSAGADSLGLSSSHDHMYQNSVDMDSSMGANTRSASGLVASGVASHQPMQDNIDDMFDDGMFDSFFGGGSSSAAPVASDPSGISGLSTGGLDGIKKETDAAAAITSASLAAKPEPEASLNNGSYAGVPGDTAATQLEIATSTAAGSNTATAFSVNSLSSPPGIPGTLSLAEPHVGAAIDPAMAAATGTELATPASIKMTPAPSIDLQSPTPVTQQPSAPAKAIDTTVATNTMASPSSANTKGTAPSIDATDAGTAKANPSSSSANTDGSASTSLKDTLSSKTKPNTTVRRISTASMTPKPYSSVTTPYDNVGISCHSWLQDSPTPAPNDPGVLVDPRHTPRDEIDSRMQCAALIEKSLNPVSWIKRVSARRMQRNNAKIRNSRKSSVRRSSELGAIPSSVRRLKGWLASYRAKSSYSRDFAPSFVLSSKAAVTGVALETENNGGGPTTSGMQVSESNGDSCTVSMARAASQDTAAGRTEVSGSLQYSGGAATAAVGFADESLQKAPSFTSIINPRRVVSSDSTQMPGTLAPSLSISDLQMVADSANKHAVAVATSNAIDGSWVPWWMQAAGGFAELVASAQKPDHDPLPWSSGIQCLARIARASLDILDCSDHLFQAHIPLMFVCPDNAAGFGGIGVGAALSATLRAENLGARIGGLLRLGLSDRSKDRWDQLQSDSEEQKAQVRLDKLEQNMHAVHMDPLDDDALANASSAVVHQWVSQARQSERWGDMVETMADWAIGSSLLNCVSSVADMSEQQLAPGSSAALVSDSATTHIVAKAIGAAMASFWHSQASLAQDDIADGKAARMDVDFEQSPDKEQRQKQQQQQRLLEAPLLTESTDNLLTLTKLVSLENPTRPPANKYRGFVVKKRRKLVSTVGSSSFAAGNSTSAGGNNGSSIGSASTIGSNSPVTGSIVVPSGPGTIEPLLDVRIVVGTHGQEDVPLPGPNNNGQVALRNRDSRSLYIKRWRYTQRLGSRATHEALVAAGEIEETEEGEEREDGEDGPPVEEETKESIENWPDPDNYTMEAEDALRRVCLVTSPVSLRWWTQMQMRPIGASKDIRWCAFVPPCIGTVALADASGGAESDEDGSAMVRDWCRVGSAVAEWYLGDVDSAYQASHLGTHRPLALNKVLDGVFTQLTESGAVATLAGQSAALPSWSARLLYDAERLGSCMAHAWYTTSQLEQQQQQKQKQSLSQSHMLPQLSQSQQQQQQQHQNQNQHSHQQQSMRGGADSGSLVAAKTLALYMMVPYSNQLALWLAMAEASGAATRAFESTLQSLITRTASGIPSSTTGVSTNVPWPSLVVHPLPLDLLSEWHRGRRLEAVPSAQETALAIYNRCPEFLSPPPPLATAHSAATVGTATTPHSSATMMGRQSKHATPAAAAQAGTQSDFMAAALGRTARLQTSPRAVASRLCSSCVHHLNALHFS
ncbi:hypothetical protein LPJ56_001070 [Coemansia sp. RSA 2599]|nr:hypothetical protein LPJ56_001070 [Coemansia sp. RSA 2599]